jgi:hypothetical protein
MVQVARWRWHGASLRVHPPGTSSSQLTQPHWCTVRLQAACQYLSGLNPAMVTAAAGAMA